ncbi:hypothetical protein LTS15_004694 [Exophiala xenobiotica]|nr:hypothetical protein LTS15_004694 [Exophiala xenobiotica]
MQDPLGDGINAKDLSDDVLNSAELAGAEFDDYFDDFDGKGFDPDADDYEDALADEEYFQQPFSIPPSRKFPSFRRVWKFLDDWTGPRGYALRIRSNGAKNKQGIITYYRLECDRASRKWNGDSKYILGQRRTKTNKGSRGIDCPFKIKVRRDDEGWWAIDPDSVQGHDHGGHYPTSMSFRHYCGVSCQGISRTMPWLAPTRLFF